MISLNKLMERAYQQSLGSKTITSIIFCMFVSLTSVLLRKWIAFDYSEIARITTAIVFTSVVGLFWRDTISYYDKVAGYDFSDFNPKKREEYTQKKDEFLGGGFKHFDVLIHFIFIIITLVISSLRLNIEFQFKIEVIYFVRTLPFPIIFYFLIFYFRRKTSAMRFFSMLENQKTIEKKRNNLIKKLKEKHTSDKSENFNENKKMPPDRLRQLLEEKKDKK